MSTWNFDELFVKAKRYQQNMRIVSWLQQVGVIPDNVNWKRAPMSVYNGLPREAIPAQALAELAYEFDKEGGGTPYEYMEWLEFEVRDSEKRNAFYSVLSSLGRNG